MTDQYKAAFVEEARDLLAELESSLLQLDANRQDSELVGRAFRALHTIKGSGAMFGFDDLARVAHHLETAFDRLRRGEMEVTSGLINLALAASDQIRVMLEAPTAGAAPEESCAGILADLFALTGTTESPAPPPLPIAQQPRETVRQWEIRFRPDRGVLLNGNNPLLLFDELRTLGKMRIEADGSKVPLLGEIEAGQCYLSWKILLTGAVSRDQIRDVFIFVEGECELSIDEAPVGPVPQALPVVRREQAPQVVALAHSSGIRVSVEKLDELVNLVGELVTVQARLSEVAARSDDADVLEIAESVDRLTAALRENSISIRMLPLRSTFERFRRLVHDLGVELDKDVDLTIEGADTELDKTVIDQLNDPLVHLIRNAMDHGIERREARVAEGKPAVARIRLSAEHSGAHVLVRVSDDGQGLDVEAIRARALQQGLIAADARLSESEVLGLILAPGFSTARTVTGVSGRGVGMDVVRRSLEALRGSVEVESRPGAGVTVTLRLPLTLAIIDGLLVRIGCAHFVLPLANSLECVELTRRDIAESHGRHIANVRGQIVPYIRLSEYLHIERETPDREQIMLVETEYGHYGFVVDEVMGDHQTVIKNLGRLYRNVQEVSGATILGNGSVALILDPHRLVQSAVQNMSLERSARRQSQRRDRYDKYSN